MKLILKLANFTAEYQLSGMPAMKYIDGNMHVIENAASEPTRVQEKPNVPAINVPNAPAKPAKAVSTTVKPVKHASNATSSYVNPFIKDLHEYIGTSDIKKIRTLLGEKFSDADMNNLIAALEIAFTSGKVRHSVIIKDILIFSMFLIAGFGRAQTRDMLRSIGVKVYMSVRDMSRIVYPSETDMAIYKRLNSLLKPYIKYENVRISNIKLVESHFDSIIEAMQAGYTDSAIARKYGGSERIIRIIASIRAGAYYLCRNRTDIKYPIERSNHIGPLTFCIHYCKKCGCTIPVSRLISTGGTDMCVRCQGKLEKATSTGKSN